MPTSIDSITHKKLILVKQLYQQAVIQSSSKHSMVSRILSVIGFDLAVETVLKAIVGSLTTTKTPADSFQSLVQQTDSLLNSMSLPQIPDKAKIQHVHSLRNDAQHKAKYPNESDVNDSQTYVKDFLQKIITDVWDISFEKISLTDLVQHKQVKDFLVKAEIALSQNDYELAVRQAAFGLTFALNHVEEAFVGYKSSFTRAIFVDGPFGELKADKDLLRTIQRMQETLLYISLGMNFRDYMHFRQISGDIMFTVNGEPLQHGQKEFIDADDANFVVMFSIESVIQIESHVGNLDAPFGKKYWF